MSADATSSSTAFLRVIPSRLSVVEEYTSRLSLRGNNVRSDNRASGEISVEVPCDGADHVPRAAYDALVRQVGAVPTRSASIGHLAFVDHRNSDLGDRLGLSSRYSIWPLTIPLAWEGRWDDHRFLSSDAGTLRFTQRYSPSLPSVHPISLVADVRDDDQADVAAVIDGCLEAGDLDAAFEVISTQSDFIPQIAVAFSVRLALPASLVKDRRPTLTSFAVSWPQPLVPTGEGLAPEDVQVEVIRDGRGKPVPWRYDQSAQQVVWKDVAFGPGSDVEGTELCEFTLPPIRLLAYSPSQLYDLDFLTGRISISFPELLSETAVELFDASGTRLDVPKLPTRTSRFHLDFEIDLVECFSRRQFDTYQRAQLDGLILDRDRADDLRRALQDAGFRCDLHPDRDGGRYVFRGSKPMPGGSPLLVFLAAEGRVSKVTRERRYDVERYTTEQITGHTTLHMRAVLKRAARPAIHELLDLHQAVRRCLLPHIRRD